MSYALPAQILGNNDEDVQFLGVQLDGQLEGLMFQASLRQHFRNPHDRHIELTYTFPLPWGAELMGVEVQLGDKLLSGSVMAKRQAESQYESTLADGDAAVMLERNGDHSYTLSLGNLAPGEDGIITLRYAQILHFEQQGLRLLIPTVIAPRYGDAILSGGMQPHQVVTHSVTTQYPFEFKLRILGELAQARIASPSHPIAVAPQHGSQGLAIDISLARQAWLDRDFVLTLDQLPQKGLCVASPDMQRPQEVALLASFSPQIPADTAAQTMLKILVDCSGSMAGDSMHAAKSALHGMLAELQKGDQFSLSRFGDSVTHASRALRPLTSASLRGAADWVDALDANMGGTEMEAALSSTFAITPAQGCDILLITDGEIWGIDSCISAAKNSSQRIFIVAIGSSPAIHHLQRLAEATGGACDFVAPGEDVAPAILRMFARLRTPRLRDIRLLWPTGCEPLWVAPLVPSVFDGATFHVHAKLPSLPQGEIQLLGRKQAGGAEQLIATATLPEHLGGDPLLSRMQAAARIASCDVEHEGSQKADELLQLAVDYQLLSPYTNFLLTHVRDEDQKATDMPELRQVPHMLAAGWGGSGSVVGMPSSSVLADKGVYASHPPHLPAIVRFRSASVLADIDRLPVPAYLRKQSTVRGSNGIAAEDMAYARALTPAELIAHLKHTPQRDWPRSLADLEGLGLEIQMVEWLQQHIRNGDENGVLASFFYLLCMPELRSLLHAGKKLQMEDLPALLKKLYPLRMRRMPTHLHPDLVQARTLLQGMLGLELNAWHLSVCV